MYAAQHAAWQKNPSVSPYNSFIYILWLDHLPFLLIYYFSQCRSLWSEQNVKTRDAFDELYCL